MNRERVGIWAAIAEIVSAIAIVGTLLYAVSEFRRTGDLSSQEVNVLLYERTREYEEMLVGSPDLARIVIAASSPDDTLSSADRLRYLSYQHVFFDTWEIAWDYHQDGILDDALWESWDAWFVESAQARPRFGWIENRRNYTGPSFIDHVDRSVLRDRQDPVSSDRPENEEGP